MSELMETNYEHLKGDSTFTVTASEQWSIAMVRRLKEKYPDEVEIIHVNKDGSMLVHMPFEWMRIVPKKRDGRSAETIAAAAERMRAWNAQKRPTGDGETEPNSPVSPEGIPQHTPQKEARNEVL